jgi:hypothetical protein
MTKRSNDLLSQLGSVAREQLDDDDPPALRALVDGSLADEEQSALEARAKTDEALAFALKTHTPLGADMREALVQRLAAERKAAKKPRTARLWLGPLGIAAAAAAALLVVWIGVDSEPSLPRYGLSHHGGLETTRGETSKDEAALSRGSELEISIRPSTDVEGPVALRLFVRQGDRLRTLEVAIAAAESGAFRARIAAGEVLADTPGRSELIALVCRPDACERAGAQLTQLDSTASSDWQVLRLPIVYTP